MSFRAPLQDMHFVMKELAGLDEILALPDFEEITEELVQAVLQENARFVEDAIAPLNHGGDRSPPTYHDGAVTTPPGFLDAFHDFGRGGWQGLQHSREWGGQGFPKLVGAPVSENINAANLAFSLCPLLTDGVIEALTIVGSKEQQARFIPPMLDGRWTGTMNLTEPQAGSDLSLVTTRAVEQPDGSYRLKGQKIFITFGEHDLAENIVHLVLARTPDAPAGVRGLSLFIVPKFLPSPDGSPGSRNDVWCASIEEKLGIHGSPTAVLLYGSGTGEVGDEGAVGELVGEENSGLAHMFIMMNAARFAVGLQGVALSERCLQHARSYAHERIQGRAIEGSEAPVAIVDHPDVQRLLCTMQALTEGARAMAYVAAAAGDRSRHHPEAAVREKNQAVYEYMVPVVKGYATEASVEVASLGIQVHGGMGFIEETGAAQYYRDARILPIYEGTTAIQANDFVGRKTLRDGGAVAAALTAEMRSTVSLVRARAMDAGPQQEGMMLLAKSLDLALDAWEQATRYVLDNAQHSVRAVYAGSVPYLMLAGVVHAGWHMARAALVCVDRIAEGNADEFYIRKLACSLFHAASVVSRADSLCAQIVQGQLTDRCAAIMTRE